MIGGCVTYKTFNVLHSMCHGYVTRINESNIYLNTRQCFTLSMQSQLNESIQIPKKRIVRICHCACPFSLVECSSLMPFLVSFSFLDVFVYTLFLFSLHLRTNSISLYKFSTDFFQYSNLINKNHTFFSSSVPLKLFPLYV